MTVRSAPSPRRRTVRIAIALAVIGAGLTLSVFVFPTHLARWLLDTKFEDLGLHASGVETVDVDLWNREIRFGPITIGAPGAKPAQLSSFGLVFSVSQLFERRGYGHEAVIDGLVLDVFRDETGRISVNGVDLFDYLPQKPSGQEKPAARLWGVGLNAFALRNSRVRITRRDGSELELEVDRLKLENFRTWTPETPGRFALAGRLNGMALEIQGEMTPFSDRVDVQAASKLSAIDLAKVERFTGPLPLSRGEGTMRAELKHKASLAPDGTIQISNIGRIIVDGLSLALPNGPEISFDTAQIALDTDNLLRSDRSGTITGTLKIQGEEARLRIGDSGEVDMSKALLELTEIRLATDPQQAITGSLSLSLHTEESQARANKRSAILDSVRFDASLADAKIEPAGSMRAAVEATLTVASPKIAGSIRGNAEQLSLQLSNGTISTDMTKFSAGGALSVGVSSLSADAEGEDGSGNLSLSLGTSNAAVSHFDVAAPYDGPLSWSASYGLELRDVRVETRGARNATIQIDRLLLEDSVLDSEANTKIGRLEVERVNLSGGGPMPDGDSISLSARTALIRVENLVRDAVGQMSLDQFTLSDLELKSGGRLNVDSRLAALRLTALTLSPDAEAGAASITLSGTDLSVDGGEDLKLRFDRMSLESVRASTKPVFQVETIAVAGLDLSASTELLPAEGAPENSAISTTQDISIGSFTLSNGAKFAFTDKRQSPPVSLQANIGRFELLGIDLAKPEAQTAISLAATVNEFTALSVEGWLNPFGARPNFDLTTAFENLELPTFSAYSAKHLGVNLETGRLSARATGQMISGELDVATKLDIRKLKFSPLSPEDAKRLSAAIGVPVETAVGLLEDGDGRIELSIPVKGDFRNPTFDLDQVIGKAVGNAITGTIGATLKVMFPPALLISVFEAAASGKAIEFSPAPFEAGTVSLQPKGRELVDALAKLMAERPKLAISVCGRATSADLTAALAPEVDAVLLERRIAHERSLIDYNERLRQLVERGLVDKNGAPLAGKPSDQIPQPPAKLLLDEQTIFAELARTQADAMRDKLSALAAERTRVIRLNLATRQNSINERVSECRPIYDPKDTGSPRAEFGL